MDASALKHPISPGFEWKTEYEGVLDRIADTDHVDTPWEELRDILKHKLFKNASLFVAENKEPQPRPSVFSPRPSTPGGLKLPPFPGRGGPMNGAPKPALSATEAQEQVDVIFTQMHEFESTPFTIQRLCDLCANRRQHYTVAGKYLRAVEKTLLVTSTWDAFPPAPAPTGELIAGVPVPVSGARTPSANGSTPSTPLFSPIPFLHADARRSASRSPPPLALAPARAPLSEPPLPPAAGGDGTVAPRGLGLVDELDDPAPGHMSAAPTALSATTTLPDEDAGAVPAAAGEGVKAEPEDPAASLADRFVSGGKEEDADKMDLDEAGDKENQATTVNTKDEKKD